MLTVREATVEDNAALLALLQAGTGGAIERSPDYFTRAKLYGQARVYVAVENDTIVATMSRTVKTVQVGGRAVRASHLFDLDYHKPHFDAVLLERCRQEDESEGVSFSSLQLLTGNPRAGVRFAPEGFATEANIWMSVLTPTPSPTGGGEAPSGVRRAVPADYPALADLLNHCYREYEYFVPFTAEGLAALVESGPGMAAANLYVREQGGRLVAALGYLDYRQVYRFVIITHGRRPRQIYGPSQYLLPWLPPFDQPWNCLLPFPLAYRDAVEDVRPLWRDFSRYAAGQKAPALLRFDQRDPLRALERLEFSGMTTSPMNLMLRTYGDFRLPGPQRLVYADPRDL